MKKIISLILALTMIFALAIGVSAAGETTIKITNATIGATYKIYKILDADVNGDSIAYSVDDTCVDAGLYEGGALFNEWISIDNKTDYPINVELAGSFYTHYIQVDDDNITDFVEDVKDVIEIEDFTATVTADSSVESVEVPGHGYYLMISSTGAVLTADTSNQSEIEVIDKNQSSIGDHDKVAKDTSGEYKDKVSFELRGTIENKLTAVIRAYEGDKKVETVVLRDAGDIDVYSSLDNLVVKVTPVGGVEKTLVFGTDYTLTSGEGAGETELTEKSGTFQAFNIYIEWKDEYGAEATIVATYDMPGYMNRDDAVNTFCVETLGAADEVLKTSTNDHVEYNTYKFKVKKVDGNGNPLADAVFLLENDEDTIIIVKPNADNTVYTVVPNETNYSSNIITGETGELTIEGVAAGTYYLRELKAPDGYTALTDPIEIVITDDFENNNEEGKFAITYPGSETVTTEGTTSADVVITVENLAGSVLPSTGGMGTTLFYILGSLMAVGALVVLVTNKRVRV